MLPDGFLRLDPRLVVVRQIAGLVTTGVVATLALAALASLTVATRPAWLFIWLGAGAWLLATALLTWWLWTWPAKAYQYASYRLDSDGLEIRRGVIWRTVVNVPRTRVQHTDVSQGPIERSYGLSTLVVHTAGTEHAMVVLPGLSRQDALSLRDQLLPRDGRDAV
ncbi:MAG TPA: PH domain-containing protein [Vicinamibacterales bacterium]|nr:PH domain-containing protein [Vicinamibacterales bacterium]